MRFSASRDGQREWATRSCAAAPLSSRSPSPQLESNGSRSQGAEGAALVWLYRKIPHRGLLAWSVALLSIVFVRLVFNPAVFSYHSASHTPIFNWYLYTYLVSAAAFFVAAYFWPREVRYVVPATSAAGTVLLFFLLNIEIADYYSTGPTLTSTSSRRAGAGSDVHDRLGHLRDRHAGGGILLRAKPARVAAIMLLAATILKCFLHDLAGWRILPGGLTPRPRAFTRGRRRYPAEVRPGQVAPDRESVDPFSDLCGALIAATASASRFASSGTRLGRSDRIASMRCRSSGRVEARLADLRFFDSSNREVGYALIGPAGKEAQWIGGAVLPIAATKTTSGFEVDLRAAREIDRLRIGGLDVPYLKPVRIEGSGDRSRWTLLADATVFDLPDRDLRQNEVAFQAGPFRYLRVTWDDRASARVRGTPVARARIHGSGAPPEPLRFTVPFRKTASEPGKSRYRIDLPGPHLPIDRIEVQVSSSDVFRMATVSELG